MRDKNGSILLLGHKNGTSSGDIAGMLDGKFTTFEAETLDDAVSYHTRNISVVLVDLDSVKGMEREVLRTVKQNFKSVPIVVISEQELPPAEALDWGACDHLLKNRLDPDLLFRSLHYAADLAFLDQALSESRQRYSELLNSLTNYVYSVQVNESVAVTTTYGQGCFALTGYASAEYEADSDLWRRMIHVEDRQMVMQHAAELLSGKTVPPLEYRIMHKDGRVRWIKNTAVPFFDPSGRLKSYDALVSDITDRKHAEQKLSEAAYYDALTGLPNRELFGDRLRQALIQAGRHGNMLAVLFLDLDRFQSINDTLGHAKGDLALKAAADRLVNCMRKGDTIARVGADEFMVLCTDLADPKNAAIVANKIQNALLQIFTVDQHEFYMTASIGISIFPQDGEDVDALIKNADAALHQARGQGNNFYQFYSSAMNAETRNKLILETDLRKALDREEFVLHYQPLIDLSTGRITGAESLVRWQHPRFGLLQPVDFIPLAEETGLIIAIGDWTIRTVCSQTSEWQRSAFSSPLRMAVNLSMRQFRNNTLIDTVFNALQNSDLDPKHLELELTESTVMQNTEHTRATLLKFKAAGIQIALDDFGTGYSSLSYLVNLPLNKLKLDHSFVSALASQKSHEAISKAIITLAHSLELKVVAEGVETIEQLELLRSLKCDEIQGYLFSRPVPHQEMTRLLQEDTETLNRYAT